MTDAVALAAARLGPLAERDVPIGPLTTYRVGGPAALFARVDSDAELGEVAAAIVETRVPVLVVGKGSNLLVADRGFNGLALVLGEHFATIEVRGTVIRAGGAASLPVVARRSAAHGLLGFEWAVGVPGSVGGAIRMNAGGHGSDMAAVVTRVRVLNLQTGEDKEVDSGDLAFAYRSSGIRADDLVLRADLALSSGVRADAEATIGEVVRWRREHQPGGPNAGSVFTNPPGDSAGRLIDVAGCKGMRVGTARISEKHANFIQADDGGRADDVWKLMHDVRRIVRDRSGVDLVPETRMIGFPVEPPTTTGDDRERGTA